MSTCFVKHLINLYAVIIYRNVVALYKMYVVELGCAVECALKHVLQFEVRGNHLVVERVFLLAELLGVVEPVPAFDSDSGTFAVGNLLQLCKFLLCTLHSRFPYAVH